MPFVRNAIREECHFPDIALFRHRPRGDVLDVRAQANGGIEVGVQIVRGMLRTLKLCLEQRIDKHMPVSHPVVAWLLEHACLVVNALVRGTGGMTAWMRVRGRASQCC